MYAYQISALYLDKQKQGAHQVRKSCEPDAKFTLEPLSQNNSGHNDWVRRFNLTWDKQHDLPKKRVVLDVGHYITSDNTGGDLELINSPFSRINLWKTKYGSSPPPSDLGTSKSIGYTPLPVTIFVVIYSSLAHLVSELSYENQNMG